MSTAAEKKTAIYLSAGVVSFSAIAYELVLATYATFLLGSTIFQYALVFSVMMAAMGVGSLLSTKFEKGAYRIFLICEILLAVLALVSVPLLYWIFSVKVGTQIVLVGLVIAFGILIGLEVPLLNSIRSNEGSVSQLLFFDYLGGFIGGLLFPLLLLPTLGFFRVSGVLAFLNLLVSFLFLTVFKIHLKGVHSKLRGAIFSLALFSLLYFAFGEAIRRTLELKLFGILS